MPPTRAPTPWKDSVAKETLTKGVLVGFVMDTVDDGKGCVHRCSTESDGALRALRVQELLYEPTKPLVHRSKSQDQRLARRSKIAWQLVNLVDDFQPQIVHLRWRQHLQRCGLLVDVNN